MSTTLVASELIYFGGNRGFFANNKHIGMNVIFEFECKNRFIDVLRQEIFVGRCPNEDTNMAYF